MLPSTKGKVCENCGEPLVPDEDGMAPHKRFCGVREGKISGKCRNEWHGRARAKREAQAQAEAQAQVQGEA